MPRPNAAAGEEEGGALLDKGGKGRAALEGGRGRST